MRDSSRVRPSSRLAAGRIHSTSLGSNDPYVVSLQSSFLRLVSITEATVDALGVELTKSRVAQVDDVLRLLMLEKELAGSSSWEARRRSFKRHHAVDLRKCAEHPRVEAAAEVRNAIAHGLGRLTTRQVLAVELPAQLARINISVVNGFVDLRQTHVADCAAYTAEFLRSLDASAVA